MKVSEPFCNRIVVVMLPQALVNIPANSVKTLQRDIAAGCVTITSEIQV